MLALCGCGSQSSTPSSPSTTNNTTNTNTNTNTNTVTANIVGSSGNQAFSPNPIAAPVGYTVVFKNNDSTTHHIVLDDGSADLGDLAPGATTSGFTVKTSSQLLFHCKIHSSMVGSLNGQMAPDPPPCSDPYGYGCTP
jgi:plastocyanin